MLSLGLGESTETYEALFQAYAEKHRHYHTQAHLDDCLEKFDRVKSLAEQPQEIELALWFHDAIYRPYYSDNELKSASWAKSFLCANGAGQARADRVHKLVMATVHAAPASGRDASLLVDVDLSILGSEKNAYSEFESAVRKEYSWAPYFLYRKKRSGILASFLNRDRIYQNDYFFQRFEEKARQNIKNAIYMLSGRQ